jgi:hypothetical protein
LLHHAVNAATLTPLCSEATSLAAPLVAGPRDDADKQVRGGDLNKVGEALPAAS